jgi:hypothetical protein
MFVGREVETGQVAKSHPGSVADLLDRWLDDIAPTRTAYTMREHRRSVERDIKPAIGPVHLDRGLVRAFCWAHRRCCSA